MRARLAGASYLPVSADFENGFGDEAEYVAGTIRLAADAGLVGCTIEDAMKGRDNPIYPFEAAVGRIEAMGAAADALGFAFYLTRRCENFLQGNTDLDDTIRELKGCEDAGAEVLMASGLPDREAVKTVCSALSNRSILWWVFRAGPSMSHHCERPASGASVWLGCRCGDGSRRSRHIRICRNGFALAEPGRIHKIARVTTLLLFFLQAGHQLDEIARSKPAVQLVM